MTVIAEDVRDSFCTPLLDLIQKYSVKGYSYIPKAEMDSLIEVANSHKDSFFPDFTDEDVARIITDPRIEWKNCLISGHETTRNFTALGKILLHMELDEYIKWLPLTQDALNSRYSPAEQVQILKQCEAMPGYNGEIVDGRQMLSGRIVPLILQDQAHLDAWVDEWMKALKYQEKAGPKLGKSFSESVKTTRAFKKLREKDASLEALPVLMPLAGLLSPQDFMASVSRYCDGSLYELSNGEHAGHFYRERDDYLRRTLVYGLYLLKGDALEDLVSRQIGHQVILDRHIDLAAALLASSIHWHRDLLDIDALGYIKAPYETQDAVDILLREHAFNWDRDWFKRLGETPHCVPLLKRVATFEAFQAWVMQYAATSRYASMSSMKQLSSWIGLMDEKAKEDTFNFLIGKFEKGITVKSSKYETGIFYGKVLLSAFPDEPFAQAKISDQVGYLVKRALKDDHTELLAAVIEKGFVTPEMVGRCLWNVEEFNQLTSHGNLTKKLLLPYVSRKIKIGLLNADMGM